MNDIASKIIPIILLIFIGNYFRYKTVFQQNTIDDMKKFIINYALPAVLFISFINIELKSEYIFVTIAMVIMQSMFYIATLLLNKIKFISHPILPYVTSACAIGLIGLVLFNAIFGVENLGKFSILGIGHELYLWLILFAQMRIKLGKKRFSMKIGLDLLKTPTIFGITLGILLNVMGFSSVISSNTFVKGLYSTIEYIANLSTPLILIIIGYGLRLNRECMRQSIRLLTIRIAVMLFIGSLFKYMVIDTIIISDTIFDYGFFTFLILPPPLSLPILVSMFSTREYEELANNLVVLNTIVSIVIFLIFVMLI